MQQLPTCSVPCQSLLQGLSLGSRPGLHLVLLQVTGRRLWKNVYDELGGSPGSTSAATCTRRHYERYRWGQQMAAEGGHTGAVAYMQVPHTPTRRKWLGNKTWKTWWVWGSPALASLGHILLLIRLVLPYVRHLKGEEDKPLPPSKPKKQYKMTKDLRGDSSTVERLRKAKEEKLGSQVSCEPCWDAPIGLWTSLTPYLEAECSDRGMFSAHR